ncbi:protein Wnt-7b-like isoform X2 [Asterias amurensis]|uniref:protein Wnt-7b-like isoform X2 n=1 Tax=Asterias amurensis TaxID=7602 RepID=UPI003AB7CB21
MKIIIYWSLSLVHGSPKMDSLGDWQSPETKRYCHSQNWLSMRQRKLCELHPDLIPSLTEGILAGIGECKRNFKDRRWNCPVSNVTAVFGPSRLRTRNPEMAFLQGMTSASITFHVTRACGSGEVVECGCAQSKGRKHSKNSGIEDWAWGGCSDNIRYGMYFTRDFIDTTDNGASDNSGANLMMQHNYESGLRTIDTNMQVKCKCHGVSGSCTSKVCWNTMPKLNEIGKIVFERYTESKFMVYSRKRRRLRPSKDQPKKPSNLELVYLQRAMDYCEPNKKHGSVGTHGRLCNKTSLEEDGCPLLCCGRGYQTMVRTSKGNCNCRFEWCCEVVCETCKKSEELHICN